jgi:hypothetical protein
MRRLCLAALAVPAVALAQPVEVQPVVIKGWDITPFIGAFLFAMTALLTYLAKKIGAAQDAVKAESGAKAAAVRLGAIGFAMIGDLWDSLSREFQTRIADGVIDANDRAAFGKIVESKIEKYTSADELKKIAEALSLPLPGIIAKIVEYAIDRLTRAHDPEMTDVSAKAYPVSGSSSLRREPSIVPNTDIDRSLDGGG